MINYIIKCNNWYDSLKEPKRTLFFFFILVPLICGTQLLLTTLYNEVGYIYWSIWVSILAMFRMVPIFVK